MAETNVQLDTTKLVAAVTRAKGAMASAKVIVETRDAVIIEKLRADNEFDNARLVNVQAAMDSTTDELDAVAGELEAAIPANPV